MPAYSPYAVAEHTLALILTLERKIHRALTGHQGFFTDKALHEIATTTLDNALQFERGLSANRVA